MADTQIPSVCCHLDSPDSVLIFVLTPPPPHKRKTKERKKENRELSSMSPLQLYDSLRFSQG